MSQFILGSTVPLTFTVSNADGEPANALTAALTIGLPDGTTTSPALTNVDPGVYTADYVPAMAGRFTVYAVTTGPATSFADVFDVRPAAPPYMVSLASVKRALNMSLTRTADDNELLGHIEAATGAVEEFLGETVVRRTVVERHDLDRPAAALGLRRYPVVAVASIASVDAATTYSGFTVDGATGVVTAGTTRFAGSLLVTYTAGRSEIPAHYLRAAELVVANMWEEQRQPGPGPRSAEEALDVDRYGTVIPPRVRELLGSDAPMVG